MSDPVWIALIGVGGTLVGSVTTIIVANIQARKKEVHDADAAKKEGTTVVGELIDIRELRILRALYGEPHGRILEAYRDGYYGPALKAVVKRGWVQNIANKYYMTRKGAEICRAYLQQITASWQPANQVLN